MDSPILIIFIQFVEKCSQANTPLFPTSLEAGQGKNTTFYFAESFLLFRLNKSVLETAETKEADSQLYFAPKIIEMHLLIFENELIEDAILVSKKSQN